MDFDNSWNALVNPGDSDSYFDMNPLENFQPDASGYSEINAWWLCEISRLIYRHGENESGEHESSAARNEILKQVGLREEKFFNRGNTQCAVICSENNVKELFGVLVFRGTTGFEGWFSNLNALQVAWPAGGMVHGGFRNNLYDVWDDVNDALSSLDFPIFYTGHSLGAALATLAASLKPPRAVYTFGSPRVGDSLFVRSLKAVSIYRVANNRDIVTTVPPSIIPFEFRHTGEWHYISHDGQMFVRPPRHIVAEDRLKTNSGFSGSGENRLRKRFAEPPKFMSDHSPVNYTAHLERIMKGEKAVIPFDSR